MSTYIILVLLGVLGSIWAADFEAAVHPFMIYDEQRLLGDVPSYRPPDDTPKATVNAFQELHLNTSLNDIFFVGERGIASAVSLDDVTDRRSMVTFTMKDNVNSGALPCETVAKDQADYLCQNYITVIQPIKDNKVIVCGTNGLVPVCYTCTYDDTTNTLSCPAASDAEGTQCLKNGVGAAGCYYIEDAGLVAFEPLQETAWLYMDDATLGEVIYAGANEEQNKDSVISRATIDGVGKINLASVVKTDKDDPDWLNNAQFVGDPIEYGDHIYFFFRETATEYINAGKIVYSRVGRVCKNDTGGGAGTMLDGLWTTFQKARLNCSTQGVFPFYFNELQDIHPATQDENVIYATFSTAETGATGSAVCVFRLDEIQQLFDNGRFKGAENIAELWLPIDNSKVPDNRPGSCKNVHEEDDFNFIKDYPLMDALVPNTRNYNTFVGYNRDSNSPLGIIQGQRIVELVVDEKVENAGGNPHDIFFLASEDGKIFKMYLPSPDDPVLIEEFNLELDKSVNEEVVTMKLKDKKLYIGTSERVVAIDVQYCNTSTKCYTCVQAQDPYCSYVDSECASETSGMQCLRETRDKKPFECANTCKDWPQPMIAYASENVTYVAKKELPVILYFTATGPKYSDLSYNFKCTCVDGDDCTDFFNQDARYQRLDKVEWVSVMFNADNAENWDNCDKARITYTATANGVDQSKTSFVGKDSSELIADGVYEDEITTYDEMMAAYKYEVKMWEEDAIKQCYPDDVTTCSPSP